MAEEPRRAEGIAAARSRAFRERARLEADRYGPDPWIFVRELLQNSRDAGAQQVQFAVTEADTYSMVRCRDDGEGMSFDHARRYLFSLYASSKENAANQAGKFGVGFWSVLRFDPTAITIRSCTRHGDGWGLRLDGSLEHATRVAPLESPGTEITLERGGGDGRLEHRIYDAVWQSGRYLYRRDNSEAPLPVTINGRSANAEFALQAPSAAFRRGNIRGVVGLGPAPRVELFSRGLRVRAAASLEDLIAPSGRHTSRMRVQFPELPGGLAPQALLESDKLEVMLSRSDARDNRALGKLVRLAQKELERLIDHQLSHARPLPLWRKVFEFAARHLRESLALRTAVGAALGAVLAVGIAWFLWGDRILPDASADATVVAIPVAGGPPGSLVARPYQDLARRYRGPRVDVLAPGSAEPIPLRYEPGDQRLYFAALTFAKLADDGSPDPGEPTPRLITYRGVACDHECFEVRLPTVAEAELVHIPIPTGHRLVENSLELNGQSIPLTATPDGHPAIRFVAPFTGMMKYRTARAPDPTAPQQIRTPPSLPDDLVGLASGLRRQPVKLRVDALVERVRELVRYDRTPDVSKRHAESQERGTGFIERTLELGAGDCDVQNGLLVAMLHAAEVEARMAVGYIGVDGQVYPWLHAWVEFRDEHGNWNIADASENAGAALPTTNTPPLVAAAGDAPADDQGGPPTPAASGFPVTPPPGKLPQQTTMDEINRVGIASAEASQEISDARVQREGDPPDEASATGFLAELDRQWPWLVRSLPFALLGLAALSLASGRTRRAIKLDNGADLSKLLQGVLQQPGAFGNVQALFTRPLVPLIDGDAISLNRARELAAIGRLYRTQQQPQIARKAVKTGAAVVDVEQPEGRTVADALGAVDLDRWAAWLDNSWADPLTEAVNEALRHRGEDWGVRIGRGLAGELAVLDLGPLGTRTPGVKARRLVLVAEHAKWLVAARSVAMHSPRAATFIALDHVCDRLDIPRDRRARLLADYAKEAVLETFSA